MPVFHIVHEALDPRSPVFRPGSFTQTALEAYLRVAGADTVIICGYQTQLCCDTTTRQARERGFQVRFASDGTAARDQRVNGKLIPHAVIHEATLAVMQTQFGAQVATAAEIAALLR